MNKKILSIFALIMAISILGVSCAENNKTTNPTTPTEKKEYGLTDVQGLIQGLSSVSVKGTTAGTVDFSKVTLTKDGTVAANAVSGTDGTGLKGSDVVSSLKTSIEALKNEVFAIAVSGTINAGATGTLTIKITAAEGYSFKTGGSDFNTSAVSSGVLTITLTLTGKDSKGDQAFV